MAQRWVTDAEVEALETIARHAWRAGDETLFLRQIAPGQFLFVYGWRAYGLQLAVGMGDGYFSDSWIYDVEQRQAGWRAALGWDGQGEPEGWYRHPQSGRRRPEGDPSREFVRR
jgi:hypothetical protein